MQLCPTCGNQVPDNAAFCSNCGTKLSAKPQSRASATLMLQVDGAVRQHRLVQVRPGGHDGASFTLSPGRSILGRGEAQIRIDDPYLSPKHLELNLREEQVTVQDLQSSNGVFLRIRADTGLVPRDEIRIGRQLLRFEPLPEAEVGPDSGRIWGSPNRGARFRVCQLLEGAGLGEALPLGDGEYLFGREEGGMTFPADPSVSRRHAILSVVRENVILRDLESANGTFLRLRRETALTPGDELLIGAQQLRYEAA